MKDYQLQNIGEKCLIIVGTYVIGKERVWQSIARELDCRVWLEKSRLEAVQCYNDPALLELLETADPRKALVHVLPLQHLFQDKLVEYLAQFEGVFTRAIAIRPSGWEKGTRVQRMGAITIVGVQYSEHSSYSELERFVRYLQPREVISTVPINGGGINKMPRIPKSWLSKEVQPKRGGQQAITNYIRVENSAPLREGGGGGSGDSEGESPHNLSMRVNARLTGDLNDFS